ncbi:MAG: hypothetical protein ACRDQG_01945 [Pseudonocardiaceae bacterium]
MHHTDRQDNTGRGPRNRLIGTADNDPAGRTPDPSALARLVTDEAMVAGRHAAVCSTMAISGSLQQATDSSDRACAHRMAIR